MTATRRNLRNSKASNSGIQKPTRPRQSKRPSRQRPATHRISTNAPLQASMQQVDTAPDVQEAEPEAELAVEGTEKVSRIYNELWESTPISLAFIDHGLLETDADTEVISLNLIDHIIKEENWNPALSMNKLSAACFLFASRVTAKHNTAADIALSFEADAEKYAAAMLATINILKMATDYTIRSRVANALKMTAEDIEYGYRILWEQKSELRELVGGYAADMDWLPMPEGVSIIEERSGQAAVDLQEDGPRVEVDQDGVEAEEAKADELMRVADAPLISPAFIELDDFETSVAENE